MSNSLQLAGASALKQSRFAPVWTARWTSGLWTNRSPLRDAASTRLEEKFYGPRGDAFLAGQNIEISTRLTPIRRPGHSVYNSSSFSNVLSFYDFRLFNTTTEQIRVMVDQTGALYNGTGPTTKSLVWTKSAGAGQTYLQNVANCLFFGNGVDQKKWQQTLTVWAANTSFSVAESQTFIIDPNGNIQQALCAYFPVTHAAVSANVATIVSSVSNIGAIIAPGTSIQISGLTVATALNNQTLTVATVSGTTMTAPFTYAGSFSNSDSGTAYVQGGTATSGGSTPSWNATLLGKTYDGSIIWVNRGNPMENWGIAAPTAAPTYVTGGSNNSWIANTFYANDQVLVDSNGNLQSLFTDGVSGATVPTWATSVGSTTTDGSAVWKVHATAAQLTWTANTVYAAGSYLVETAGGAACLFKQSGFSGVQLSGTVSAALWAAPHTGPVGAVILTYPTTIGSALATATGNSLVFDPPAQLGAQPVKWATLNGAGTITGYTVPFSSYPNNYQVILQGNMVIPAAGNVTFSCIHQDGMIWGMGGGAAIISSTGTNAFGQTTTPINNYPIFGGNNVSGTSTDTFVVNFPAAGTYPYEICFDYWYHSGQTMVFTANGQQIVPQPASSGSTAPIWPAWTQAGAPNYPSVSETNGQITWENIGPIADYAWKAGVNFSGRSSIIDQNNNTQNAYEAGVSGTTSPVFSTTYYGLTPDNPNLTWICEGQASATPTGTITTVDGGWQYGICLVNTLDDTVSDMGTATVATGNFRGSTGVVVTGGVPATYDPQCDYVAIFRTQDGGSTFYLIPGFGNTPYTIPIQQYIASGYTDKTTDRNLNILIEAPTAEQNALPPAGAINLAYHLSRIFVSVGNTVYWSTGPDTPVGNGNNGFDPDNFAEFPSFVKKMVPTGIGLLVFTISDVYIILGNGTSSSPLYPQPYIPGIGLLSYNALDINGTTIYLFTSDRQLLSLDPANGVSQVGFPIGDQFELSSWNPSTAYVTWHTSGTRDQALYVGNGTTGWFRLCPTPAPETGMLWSPMAILSGGCSVVQSVETSPGTHQLLVAQPATGPLLFRDLTTATDNGSSFTANATIGSLVVAQPGQLAELLFITTDAGAIGSHPAISVLIGEISGTFESLANAVPDPTQLPASASLYSDRWYFAQTGDPAVCRHLQIQFAWPAEAYQNELLSLTLFGGFSNETFS
jgi:hypothetical protein